MTTHWCTLIAICGLHKFKEILWEQWKLGKLDGIVHKGWKKGGEGGTGCGSKRPGRTRA